MKVRILNGSRGEAQTVKWKDDSEADLISKAVRSVNFCLGVDVVGSDGVTYFQPKQDVQCLRFDSDTTASDISTAVIARARVLEALIVADATPLDTEL